MVARPISVLSTAYYSKTDPLRTAEPHHNPDPRRLQRVEDTVAHLMFCTEPWLTSSARKVLFEEPEMPGKLWVMQVLMTAARIADMTYWGHGRSLETLSCPFAATWPLPDGVFSLLQGVQEAEKVWLSQWGGCSWPYSPEEAVHISRCHMAAAWQAAGISTPLPQPPRPPRSWLSLMSSRPLLL